MAPALGASATRTAQLRMVRFQAPFSAKTPFVFLFFFLYGLNKSTDGFVKVLLLCVNNNVTLIMGTFVYYIVSS